MKFFKTYLTLIALCGLSATFIACGSDDDGGTNPTPVPTNTAAVPTNTATVAPTPTAVPEVCEVTPGEWSAPDWETNAAEALALRAQLDALVGANAMRGGEQGTVVIGSVAQLEALYEAGDPSIADVTTPAYDAVVANVFDDFVALLAAGTFDPIDDSGNWTPGDAGGVFGGSQRGINAGGLEVRQLADKGLFAGGALYNYALGLTEGAIDAATIDALAAAWGTNADLDPAGSLTDSANYSEAMGFHDEIAAALTDAKAYAADENCTAERDEALRAFFRNWEQSMLARLVFYANDAKRTTDAATSDDNLIAALHQLAEGAGLGLGFRGLPDPATGPLAGAGKVITDAQLDELAVALRVDLSDLNASNTAQFIEGDAADIVLAVEAVVAEAYDLSEEEIAAYRESPEN